MGTAFHPILAELACVSALDRTSMNASRTRPFREA